MKVFLERGEGRSGWYLLPSRRSSLPYVVVLKFVCRELWEQHFLAIFRHSSQSSTARRYSMKSFLVFGIWSMYRSGERLRSFEPGTFPCVTILSRDFEPRCMIWAKKLSMRLQLAFSLLSIICRFRRPRSTRHKSPVEHLIFLCNCEGA